MPIEFGPTKRVMDEDIEESPRAAEAMREAVAVATKSAAIWVAVGAVAMVIMVYLLQEAIMAAEDAYRRPNGEWYHGAGPGLMFAIVGFGFGCLLGWRITASAGLAGSPAWRIGAVATLLL